MTGKQRVYTVNVRGSRISVAEIMDWHAYYANGVTAIEIPAANEQDAKAKATRLDLDVLYVFE